MKLPDPVEVARGVLSVVRNGYEPKDWAGDIARAAMLAAYKDVIQLAHDSRGRIRISVDLEDELNARIKELEESDE